MIDNETRQWMQELYRGQHDLVIGIFDQNEQLVVTDSESECILYSDDIGLSFDGNTKVRASMGYCTFTSLRLFGHPGTHSTILVQANSPRQTLPLAPLSLPVTFRACLPGEVN
jgi:hypothetical protein